MHDLVDFVTKEAYTAGESAAKYILNDINSTERTIPVKACGAVRYTVPQKISVGKDLSELKFYFRVGETLKKPTFSVKADGEVIKTVKKQIAAPGEMESITLSANECAKIKNADLLEICNG